jgi:SAM-dependent methyltransferase
VTVAYQNPFNGLTPPDIYKLLREPNGHNLPVWPPEGLQANYGAASGPPALEMAFEFVNVLEKDGAFAKVHWRGLDYGCGFGRIATAMLAKGPPQWFDLCDAWDKAVEIIKTNNYKNAVAQVPEVLGDHDLPAEAYDFVTSFSVFTHLAPEAWRGNLARLHGSLTNGGAAYITVWHEDFAP